MFIKICRLIALTFSCCLIASCAITNNPSSTNFIVLDYSDFGPQEIAEELIGPNYWQWDTGHYSRPQKFDIKVVVFRDMKLDAVKAMFPIDRNNKKDFRYVEYHLAMTWYDKQISYFNQELASSSGDKNIVFYVLRNLYVNSLKIERGLRK